MRNKAQIALLLALSIPSAIIALPVQEAEKSIAWGEPIGGVQMALSIEPGTESPAQAPVVALHLRNIGSSFREVVLGEFCVNVEVPYANSVTWSLTDSSGNTHRYQLPSPPSIQGMGSGCAGAVGIVLANLLPDAEYSLPLHIDYYQFKPGDSLQAELPPVSINFGPKGRPITSGKLVIGSWPKRRNQQEPAWGDTVNGMQMAISLDPSVISPSQAPALKFHLRNVQTEAATGSAGVVLGRSCQSAEAPYSNLVKLNLSDPSGSDDELTYVGAGPPYTALGACAGKMEVFDVGLLPGAVYSVPLKLDYYRFPSSENLKWVSPWQPGETDFVQAELETLYEVDSYSFFGKRGKLVSNKLEIHFPAK
jgi:hypothetical protein